MQYTREEYLQEFEGTEEAFQRAREIPENELPYKSVPTGTSKIYYLSGALHFEVHYKGKDEEIKEWYPNGQLKEILYKNDGQRDGLYRSWYENGQQRYIINYKQGFLNGSYEGWYPNGQRKTIRHYKMGTQDGLFQEWDEDGSQTKSLVYKDGWLVEDNTNEEIDPTQFAIKAAIK